MKTTENSNDHCWLDDTFLSSEQIRAVIDQFGTPLFIYDEKGLRLRAKSLLALFPEVGERHYFPVRKCAIPAVLRAICGEGFGLQCQTPQELELALACGCRGEKILYCAVSLQEELAQRLIDLDAALLAASPLVFACPLPRRVSLLCWVHRGVKLVRHHSGIGFSLPELPSAVQRIRSVGVHTVGLSMRYDGNVTDETFLSKQVEAALHLADCLAQQNSPVDTIHLDGGLGVQYNRVKLRPMEPQKAADAVKTVLKDRTMPVSMTLGHYLLEPCAVFAARVLGVQQSDNPVVLVDAASDLIRFSTMDRYHHISITGKDWIAGRIVCDVVGNLPGFGDWFAKARLLPAAEAGDLLLLHDVGCSMQPNTGVAAILAREDGTFCKL